MFDINEIKDPLFLKNLSIKEQKELANDIRTFLINSISKTGGHLASNLGVVELTIALYSVFDFEKDTILFDVGHQMYVHKILTGRAKEFNTLRKFNGLSGYASRKESKYDVWESGHSSTSISALAGLMLSNGKNSDKKVIAVIGDASIVNGTALEGLNYIGSLKDQGYSPIIILNDNKMGISKSVGALSSVFNKLRSRKFLIKIKNFFVNHSPKFIVNFCHKIERGIKGYIQKDNIFEDLGFDYYGPYNGNDLKSLEANLNRIKDLHKPAILHIYTKKGKGYKFSEEDNIGNFHGVEPFDIETGKALKTKEPNVYSYSDIVAHTLCELRKNNDFFVITPAMKVGSKLDEFSNTYKNSFIDVGIAEEHAAVMSCGLALGGKKAVLIMYSTFAQRAYDYFLNDIARQDLPIVIGLDRAGIVGGDGQTHAGIYDVAMFDAMPNVVVTMPRNAYEVMGLFNTALTYNHPMVIRYPRLDAKCELDKLEVISTPLCWEYVVKGSGYTIITYGKYVDIVLDIINKYNLNITLINARVIKPLDMNFVNELIASGDKVLTIEEVVLTGSIYERLTKYIKDICGIYLPINITVPHGSINEVLRLFGLDNESIENKIKEFVGLDI